MIKCFICWGRYAAADFVPYVCEYYFNRTLWSHTSFCFGDIMSSFFIQTGIRFLSIVIVTQLSFIFYQYGKYFSPGNNFAALYIWYSPCIRLTTVISFNYYWLDSKIDQYYLIIERISIIFWIIIWYLILFIKSS